jgi:Zincin-like metallopeptidase
MRLSDFETMIRRMADEVPAEFLRGIAEIVVSPRAVPHPEREEIYTLGECIPLPGTAGEGVDAIQSRVVLYHGSFSALARLTPGFDWRQEAWETLSHELRHHLEWRARAPELEQLDWAVEQNFARHDGESFDPGFHLDGEPLGEGRWRVDDDVFIDRVVGRLEPVVEASWGGRDYRVSVPAEATLPAFLTLEGVAEPPEGDLVLVLRRKPGVLSLLRAGTVFQSPVRVEPSGYLSSS